MLWGGGASRLIIGVDGEGELLVDFVRRFGLENYVYGGVGCVKVSRVLNERFCYTGRPLFLRYEDIAWWRWPL